MDERVSEESKQMGETIRESGNECEKVTSKMKKGVDWGRGEKRKVKGGQKIKGRKRCRKWVGRWWEDRKDGSLEPGNLFAPKGGTVLRDSLKNRPPWKDMTTISLSPLHGGWQTNTRLESNTHTFVVALIFPEAHLDWELTGCWGFHFCSTLDFYRLSLLPPYVHLVLSDKFTSLRPVLSQKQPWRIWKDVQMTNHLGLWVPGFHP